MIVPGLTIFWAVLVVVVLSLVVARRLAAHREDDSLHLRDSEVGLVQRQASLAAFINHVDRAGKLVTVILLLYTAALIGRAFYLAWLDSLQIK